MRRRSRSACWRCRNLRLRNVETLKANVIGLGLYTENDKIKKTCYLWFDDVVAATSYIGPMAKAK